MVGRQSTTGVYLMRWSQAGSGPPVPWLGKMQGRKGSKASFVPVGHNVRMLSKLLGAAGTHRAMPQHAKKTRKKY